MLEEIEESENLAIYEDMKKAYELMSDDMTDETVIFFYIGFKDILYEDR